MRVEEYTNTHTRKCTGCWKIRRVKHEGLRARTFSNTAYLPEGLQMVALANAAQAALDVEEQAPHLHGDRERVLRHTRTCDYMSV